MKSAECEERKVLSAGCWVLSMEFKLQLALIIRVCNQQAEA